MFSSRLHISRLLLFACLFLTAARFADGGRNYMKFLRRFACHDGFLIKGVCFQLHLKPATYEEAEAICQKNNGTLAQYAAHRVHKRLVEIGLTNIRVGMKYTEDCDPYSDETGSRETIESNWFRKVSHCDKKVRRGDCMLLVDEAGEKSGHKDQKALYVDDSCDVKRSFMCKIYISADWNLVKTWNEVMQKNTVEGKPMKISPTLINQELGVDLPEGDLKLLTSNRPKRTINPYNLSPFNKGIICYKIDDGFNGEQKQFIIDQMTKISSKCCVQFVELIQENLPNCDNHYLYVINGGGCWSYVGKTPQKTDSSNGFTYQELSLYHSDWATCLVPQVTQHELLHAVGFWHEHSRADRDYYVKVYPENAKDGKEHNFLVKNHDVYMSMGSFDIMSAMMYSRDEFLNASRGAYTVLDRMAPFSVDDNDYFGSNEASDGDMNKCNRIYHSLCKARDGTEMPYYEILASWSTWSACSKVCGGGIQKRTRSCNVPDGCLNVTDKREEEKACNTQPCPERYSYHHLGTFKSSRAPQGWLEVDVSRYDNEGWDDIRKCAEAAKDSGFTEFGLLEGTCLHGVDYLENGPFLFPTSDGRGRYALGLFDAVDVYSLSQNADRLMTGYWTQWSGWSSCSTSCGTTGVQTRSREWLTPNGVDLPYDSKLKSEIRPCNRFNCDFQCGTIQCLYGDCVDGTCQCWPGYLGEKCTRDVNVCDCCTEGTFTGVCENVDPAACCDVNAYCIDKFGTYEANCLCKDGYYGDGHTCKKNPCDDDPCGENEICTIDSKLNPVCSCQHGYKRDPDTFQCVDYNECVGINKCNDAPMSECKDLNGTYMCICVEGTVGDGIHCSDLDECALGIHKCPPDTVCENLSPSYLCKCGPGLALEGSVCTDIDECATGSSNCDVNADCFNNVGSYECTCKEGYEGSGETCTDVDECSTGTHKCSSFADCVNTEGSYTCSCKSGYLGNGFDCTDIDECLLDADVCSPYALCTNTEGAYTCTCKSGYEGDGKTCLDIDECARNLATCHVDASCYNTDGSYQCVCKPGYEGDGRNCKDIDECLLVNNVCSENALCTNTDGSYTCACKSGYDGDGKTCSDKDECADGTDPCDSNALCTNTDGSYTCTCNEGYMGDGLTCEIIDLCMTEANICDQNAYCASVNGLVDCTCKSGYTGNGITCTGCLNSDCSDPCDTGDQVLNLADTNKVTQHGSVSVSADGVSGLSANLLDNTAYIEIGGSCLNNPETCSRGLTAAFWFRQTQEQRDSNQFEAPEVIFTSGPEPVRGVTEDDGLGVAVYRKVQGGDSLTVLLRVSGRDYIGDIASSMFENDKWNHIAFSWDATNGLKIYFNGHLRDEDRAGQSPTSPENVYDQIYFGHALQYHDRNYFLGSYGEFRMWQSVLSDAEVYSVYTCNVHNVCQLDLCHVNATCTQDACQCKSGTTGDGFTCTIVQEPDESLSLPEASYYWKMVSLSKQAIQPTKGAVTLLPDNRLQQLMTLVDGVYKYEKSIMCDGRHDAFKSSSDFSDLCHGVPDTCQQGFAVTFWIRFDGRDLFGSFMRPNFILSTGGHAGSDTTGITVWVIGSRLRVDVQTTESRYRANTSIYPLGVWKHVGIVFAKPTTTTPGYVTVYINGQRAAVATAKAQQSDAVGNHYLTLCRPNNCQSFMGRFDMTRLAMWNTPLTDQQVLDVHDHGVFGDGE